MKLLNLLLSLPFMLALGLGLHWLASRSAKAVAWAAMPLASGEAEACHYERRVYHTAQPQMLQVMGLALCGGLVFWGAWHWGPRWLWAVGLLMVGTALALDLLRWERVSASANGLWSQSGLGGEVQQVAIEDIGEIDVEEEDVAGLTLRHGRHNRLCRLQVRLTDGEPVDLPWTDAGTGLDEVEALANHLRARQSIRGDRQSLQAAAEHATEAARAAAAQAPGHDAERLRELKRLRRGALAPDVPKAAPYKPER